MEVRKVMRMIETVVEMEAKAGMGGRGRDTMVMVRAANSSHKL